MPSSLSEFNRMFVVALSVLFQLCLFHFKLMLIHDGAVLAPAWIAGLNTATLMYSCAIIYMCFCLF